MTNDECLRKGPSSMKRLYQMMIIVFFAAGFALGCGAGDATSTKSTAERGKRPAADEAASEGAAKSKAKRFQPVELTDDTDALEKATSKAKTPDEKKAQATLAALQPFQVLLGDWSWGTRKSFGNFSKTGEDL